MGREEKPFFRLNEDYLNSKKAALAHFMGNFLVPAINSFNSKSGIDRKSIKMTF